jgi:hypothetical protein
MKLHVFLISVLEIPHMMVPEIYHSLEYHIQYMCFRHNSTVRVARVRDWLKRILGRGCPLPYFLSWIKRTSMHIRQNPFTVIDFQENTYTEYV